MIANLRSKDLVAQHIEVALVYSDMLGLDDAMAYLERERVPRDTAERVLLMDQHCQQPALPPPAFRCRRENRVHDAIVEAALKVERRVGAEHALALLRQEQVPDAVIARVIAPGPRQLRARQHAAA